MDIIIGAGVSGLSYAMFSPNTDYRIFEASDSVGGYCKTTLRNGYVWDYSGHFFHFRDKDIEKIVETYLSDEDLITVQKMTRIKYKNKLIDYPFQQNIHQLPKSEFIDCLYDLFQAGDAPYRNFEQMLYCKFGKAIANKFLIPYNSKLYACDLNTLDKDAMGRFFPYAAKEDIIRNFKHTNNQTYNASFVYPKLGAIQYINAITSHIDTSKIVLKQQITDIDLRAHTARTASGEVIRYDKLISTVPFPALLRLCNCPFDESVYSWNQVLVFNLGFAKQGKDTQDHWIYFPERKYCFYRVGFYSNILRQDRMSLYVELGFNRHEEVCPERCLERVLTDLKKANILSEDNPLVDYETIVMNPAYVHITEQSVEDVQRKKQVLAQYDVYSIGRYGSWTYCSIEDNIKEAQSLVQSFSHNS